MYSRLVLVGMILLASMTACLAFGGMQSHVPAYSSPLFSSSTRRTIRFNTFRDRHEKDKDEDDIVEPEIEVIKITPDHKKTFAQTLDDFGQSLKPKALKLKATREGVTNAKERTWLTVKICALFMGFIVYRAYRGFFILLPAVFKEVYRKLESTVDSPFVDEPGEQDINPETGKMRLRTRFTVSILSVMVTLTYVIGGSVNVLMKFVKTVTKSRSPIASFEAAATEAQVYETKIRKMTHKEEDINDGKSSGLTP